MFLIQNSWFGGIEIITFAKLYFQLRNCQHELEYQYFTAFPQAINFYYFETSSFFTLFSSCLSQLFFFAYLSVLSWHSLFMLGRNLISKVEEIGISEIREYSPLQQNTFHNENIVRRIRFVLYGWKVTAFLQEIRVQFCQIRRNVSRYIRLQQTERMSQM